MTDRKPIVINDSGILEEIKNSDRLSDGTLHVTYFLRANGVLRVIQGLDPTIAKSGTITNVKLFRQTKGSSGSIIIDINKNGTTIFTNQANRPEINFTDGDNFSVESVPNITSLQENDILTLDIDQIEDGISETIYVEINA